MHTCKLSLALVLPETSLQTGANKCDQLQSVVRQMLITLDTRLKTTLKRRQHSSCLLVKHLQM